MDSALIDQLADLLRLTAETTIVLSSKLTAKTPIGRLELILSALQACKP